MATPHNAQQYQEVGRQAEDQGRNEGAQDLWEEMDGWCWE